jgi:hypothetical protein
MLSDLILQHIGMAISNRILILIFKSRKQQQQARDKIRGSLNVLDPEMQSSSSSCTI